MRVSTKGRYALRIMADLAEHDSGEYIRLKDISKRQNITLKYMEQIMPMLIRAGYVKSCRGNNGGYMLAKRPVDYRVGDILRVTEGNFALVPCTGEKNYPCGRQEECSVAAFWEGMNQVISEYVDSVTLADLIKTKVE